MAGSASAACRQALSLGMDVSGSVDAQEYRLQLDGLANALGARAVQDILLDMPETPVALHIYEWSGPSHQRVLLDWTPITGPSDLARIITVLRTTQRVAADPSTALGTAMSFGATALDQGPACWRKTLDISGDGKNNTGPRPQAVRAIPQMQGITINGLVIGSDSQRRDDQRQGDIAELSAYYQTQVVLGRQSFVETALGFEAFEAAMTRKLIRELQSVAIGALQ
ncbi:DUF1194 domain-containing protein [Nereida sp. MMG024]|nr:DUF1194 domain-containing protein [Nereida sp. MMG025]